jgi:hypothetical protein
MLRGMKTLIAILCALPIAAAAADDEDKAFRHILTLVQTFTSIAAQSASPERDIADVLAGRNESANQAASGLLQEITADMPAATRSQMSAIGADLLSIARRSATPFSAPAAAQLSATDSVQGAQGSDRDGVEVPRLERVPRGGEAQRRAGGRTVHRRQGREPRRH